MKLHNPFKIADESDSPMLMFSVIISVLLLLWIFSFYTMPYGLLVIPAAAFARVAYAIFKGK